MLSMPVWVQLRRTNGWRKPAGALVVARPSRWGNPHRVGVDGDRLWCVDRFRDDLRRGVYRSVWKMSMANWPDATWPAGAVPRIRATPMFSWRWPTKGEGLVAGSQHFRFMGPRPPSRAP
jgi:hypothetical protein